MSDVVSVGLVGAGPWARLVHAPVFAAGPETRLAGVWARRADQAAEVVAKRGGVVYERYEDLVDAVDVVAFCVPPDVQAAMAPLAARAGRVLVLEKPIAGDLAGAERLADAIGEAGTASMVVLSWRYARAVRDFVGAASAFAATGGRAWYVSGAILGGAFATPWRLERGALLDVGPHVLDLLDATLGPIVDVQAHGDSLGWMGLLLDHEGGQVSEASLCVTSAVQPQRVGLELYGREGVLELDFRDAVGPEAFATLRRELAEVVAKGSAHPIDVHRGLHLQRVIDRADRLLAGR